MGARQLGAVLAVVLCVSAVLCASAAVGASGSATAESAATDPPTADERTAQTQLQNVTPDTIVMRVDVHENGTASWEVAYRTRLDDAETSEAFRGLRNDIERNDTEYTDQFTRRMEATIGSAERATGRNMSGEDFGVDAEIRPFPQRYGVVTYSFEWTNFAEVSDGEIRAGDALSGLPLNDKTQLLVSWPEGYDATTVRPPPDEERNGTAVWTGPMEFASNEPRVVLAPPAGGPAIPWPTVAAAVGLLGVLAAGLGGGWWLFRRRDRPEATESGDELPEDLLSNEERVLRLLEHQGGRVKQRAIVNELGWTEAKTSQVVGSLREQGKIESFRLGRENVLALPQDEP
ncbi:helix-turn-helix transcriptional regulator [Halorussus amylolyticus]|uniref:helix-turn-helix transcriptional regulator n=1 Tax=Halorussus amylolyticus TaxID=1126242 RepID=UPI00104D0EFC|nr:hypothetical protein [Halorussus amylolyticus]